jgi:type III restriction enzyme
MRLLVNQKGERVPEDKLNVLTVIANESYEQFVATLQAEMVEAFGEEGAAPRPVNARQKQVAKRKPLDHLPPEFAGLWERIKHKTRYQVQVDADQLIADVVDALDQVTIDPPRIVSIKAAVEAEAKRDQLLARQQTAMTTLTTLTGRGPVPNLAEMIADLLDHTAPPIRLTRRTLVAILRRTANLKAGLDNPQEFATQAARIIREKAVQQLVDGIQYHKSGTWYEMSEWIEEEETSSDRLVPVDKSLYDHVLCDSAVERLFVEKLQKRDDVRLFVKLPAWFKVPTPVGQYNPDWALVMEQRDPFGCPAEGKPLLYLVRETKGTTVAAERRGTENQKIHCGGQHFTAALGVDYRVVTSADDLP